MKIMFLLVFRLIPLLLMTYFEVPHFPNMRCVRKHYVTLLKSSLEVHFKKIKYRFCTRSRPLEKKLTKVTAGYAIEKLL